MVVSQHDRFEMLEALRATLGERPAMTLAEHLPPAGWGDVATRSDVAVVRKDVEVVRTEIDVVRTEMSTRFDAIDQQFDGLSDLIDARIHRALLAQTFAMTGLISLVLKIAGVL